MFRLPGEGIRYHICCTADDRLLAGFDHHLLCVVGRKMYPWAQWGTRNPHFAAARASSCRPLLHPDREPLTQLFLPPNLQLAGTAMVGLSASKAPGNVKAFAGSIYNF
jgi:hypothetical protein